MFQTNSNTFVIVSSYGQNQQSAFNFNKQNFLSIYNIIKQKKSFLLKMSNINFQSLFSFIGRHPITPAIRGYIQTHAPPDLELKHMEKPDLEERIRQIKAENGCKETPEQQDEALYCAVWKKGELKLFGWFVLFYCFARKLTPADLV
jgi:hypothetical protein